MAKSSTLIVIPIMGSLKNQIPGITHFLEAAAWKFAVVGSTIITGFQAIVNHYILNHSEWIQAIMMAVACDTITGVWKSLENRKFSSYRLGAVFTKIILYALLIRVFMDVEQIPSVIAKAFAQMGYGTILVRETLSLVENVEAIRPGTFPKWFVKRLDDFDNTGKLKTK